VIQIIIVIVVVEVEVAEPCYWLVRGWLHYLVRFVQMEGSAKTTAGSTQVVAAGGGYVLCVIHSKVWAN
jgi:hypothetical protein